MMPRKCLIATSRLQLQLQLRNPEQRLASVAAPKLRGASPPFIRYHMQAQAPDPLSRCWFRLLLTGQSFLRWEFAQQTVTMASLWIFTNGQQPPMKVVTVIIQLHSSIYQERRQNTKTFVHTRPVLPTPATSSVTRQIAQKNFDHHGHAPKLSHAIAPATCAAAADQNVPGVAAQIAMRTHFFYRAPVQNIWICGEST